MSLISYVNKQLMLQMLNELDDTMPEDFTFVFGHTHKPLERDEDYFDDNYPIWVSL